MPGWYRGDLHVHTSATDADYSPSQLVEMARAERLDFMAITDHNTIEPLSEIDEGLDLLVLPGIEITLSGGDMNVFGVAGWRDWMEDICVGEIEVPLAGRYRTTTELMRRTAAEGLLNSINHPFLQPYPWQYGATDLRYVHCLEVWNAPFLPNNARANPRAVAMWTTWLNAGYRITAVGGSDFHRPPSEGDPGGRLGLPSTYVHAEELSVAAVLEGLRRRRAYVSIGPQVTFQAGVHGATYGVGADLGEQDGEIDFTAAVSGGSPGAYAQILKNGRVVAEAPVQGGLASLRWGDRADPARSDWYRLDVYDRNGQRLAVTNPIFAGPRPRPALHRYEDFTDVPDRREEA
jgi:hypothetical protein